MKTAVKHCVSSAYQIGTGGGVEGRRGLAPPPIRFPYVLPEDGFNLDFRGFQHVQRRLPAESMTVRFRVGFYMNFRKNSMNFCNSVSFESRSTSQATTSLISQ